MRTRANDHICLWPMTNQISVMFMLKIENFLFTLTRLEVQWKWLQSLQYYDIASRNDVIDDDTHLRCEDFISRNAFHSYNYIVSILIQKNKTQHRIQYNNFGFSLVSNANGIWYGIDEFFFTRSLSSNIMATIELCIYSVDNNDF